jgi:hypothetical protein
MRDHARLKKERPHISNLPLWCCCMQMGADIVDMSSRSNMHKDCAMDFVRMFETQLTLRELRDIQQ